MSSEESFIHFLNPIQGAGDGALSLFSLGPGQEGDIEWIIHIIQHI